MQTAITFIIVSCIIYQHWILLNISRFYPLIVHTVIFILTELTCASILGNFRLIYLKKEWRYLECKIDWLGWRLLTITIGKITVLSGLWLLTRSVWLNAYKDVCKECGFVVHLQDLHVSLSISPVISTEYCRLKESDHNGPDKNIIKMLKTQLCAYQCNARLPQVRDRGGGMDR